MKKTIISLVFIVILSSNAFAKIAGVPIEDDQYAHMFGSAYMTEVGKKAGMDWWQTSLMVLGVSYAKEMSDTNSTGFNTADISFGMVGVAMSYGFDSLMNIVGMNPIEEKAGNIDEVKNEKLAQYSLEDVEEKVVNAVEKMRESDDKELKQLAQYGEEFMIDYYKYDAHIRFFKAAYHKKENGLFFAHNNTFVIRKNMTDDSLDRTIVALIVNYKQNMTDSNAFDTFISGRNKKNVGADYLAYQQQAIELADKYMKVCNVSASNKVAMR